MFRDLRLNEYGADIWVESRGEQRDGHAGAARAQLLGLVDERDRVVVDDTKDRIVLVLQPSPILHCTEVVPDVQFPRRLNPTENP